MEVNQKELFVSFTEMKQFFRRHIRQYFIVVVLFALIGALLPLRFYNHEYSASSTILISCEVPEDAGTDYRLQYTGILSTRVQAAVAMANGTDMVQATAQKLGIKEDQILNISATQLNSAPLVKVTVTTPVAKMASVISDTAAEVLGERLENAFPSPKITASISDKAIPQQEQSKKRTMVKTGVLGAIAGFLIYLCFGIVVVLTDKTIRNSDFVSEALNLPFLGSTYKFGSEEKKLNGFRKLRAAAVHQGGEGKTFLVTDVCMNNGSAEVVIGLGKAMARSEKSVLLINADVRTQQIAQLLGVKSEHNLYDVLEGTCTAQQAVSETSMKGVSLIAGADRGEEDLSDILATDKFRTLLDELAPKFDYVLVNVPSEVRFPDADNLAPLCDSVIMVAKCGSTPYRDFKDSYGRLKTSGANVIGFVTTDC